MADIPNRREHEERLATLIRRASSKMRRRIIGALGTPPNVDNIPAALWVELIDDVEQQSYGALAALYLLALGGMDDEFYDGEHLLDSDKAAEIASEYATLRAKFVAESIVDTFRKGLGRAAASGVAESIDEWARDALETQAETASITETTSAWTMGELEWSRYAAEEGLEVEGYWITQYDSDVCEICSPYHGQPESVWGLMFPLGPGSAHPRCRCYLSWRVVGRRARGGGLLPLAGAAKSVSFGGSLTKNCGTGAGGFQPGNTCAKGGGGDSYAQVKLEISDAHGGELFGYLQATRNGEPIGKVDLSAYEGDVRVSMVEVGEAHRGHGVGLAMMKQVYDEFPDHTVDWGYLTEDGVKLQEAFDKKYPGLREGRTRALREWEEGYIEPEEKLPFGTVLDPGDASNLAAKMRAGDHRSKHGGVEQGGEFIREPMVVSRVPLSIFDRLSDTRYPEDGSYLDFIRSSSNMDRVANYAKQKIETPILVQVTRDTNQPVISDGGHRTLAAIARGDTEINAIIPVALHEQLHGKRKSTSFSGGNHAVAFAPSPRAALSAQGAQGQGQQAAISFARHKETGQLAATLAKAFDPNQPRDELGRWTDTGASGGGKEESDRPEIKSRDPRVSSPQFKQWFGRSQVVDDKGQPLKVYHGAQRPDRIKDEFRADRATSGPMAFFTDDPEIAGKYAEGKQDTSLEGTESYSEWFKVTLDNGRQVDLDKAWMAMSYAERQAIRDTLPHVVSVDEEGNEIDGYRLGGKTEYGVGGKDHWEHTIREHHGNVLAAARDVWLDSGVLFNSEQDFEKVLKLGGLSSKVEMESPHAAYSGVYATYLSIEKPFDTSKITPAMVRYLEKEVSKQPAVQPSWQSGADMWDKRTKSGKDWIAALKDDHKQGTSHAWTSIPDFVTEALKKKGYDGIKDTGGKMGGDAHTVWIPFSPEQIKSAVGNSGEYSKADKRITKAVSFGRSLVKNCGTGAGGFQPGNTCAKGGGTDSPEFKAWFGDSKIVGKDSKPIVVYHGGAAGIEEFDVNKAGSVQVSDWGKGIYFTSSKNSADYYREEYAKHTDQEANRLWEEYEEAAKRLGTSPMNSSIDLGFQSPKYNELQEYEKKWRIRLREVESDKTLGEVYPVYLKIERPFRYTATGMTDPTLADYARSHGHDGVIIQNEGGFVEEIIAFDSSQVKRADNSHPTASRNIRKSISFARSLTKNCGTGAGGFQPGNTCAKGGGEGRGFGPPSAEQRERIGKLREENATLKAKAEEINKSNQKYGDEIQRQYNELYNAGKQVAASQLSEQTREEFNRRWREHGDLLRKVDENEKEMLRLEAAHVPDRPDALRSSPEDKNLSYDQLKEKYGEAKLSEMFENARKEQVAWERKAKYSITMGELSQESLHRDYKGITFSGGEKFEPLPATLYHVTTAAGAVEREGLKTREELQQGSSGKGLGGGPNDTISFTSDYGTAEAIYSAMREAHAVSRGQVSIDEMLEIAREGRGAKEPWASKLENDADWKEYARRAASSDPETALYGRMQAFKKFAYWREHAGGTIDPLFFATDQAGFAAIDPEDIKIVTVEPNPGARGYQVSALGEWRTFTGDAVKVRGASKGKIAKGLLEKSIRRVDSLTKAFDPNQPRDERGRWTDTGASSGALPVNKDGTVTIFRGENTTNKGGSHYSISRDFARQFTQTGRDEEVRKASIKANQIYTPATPVYAGDADAMDKAIEEAQAGGFKAVVLSEGGNEPNTIYVIDKSALSRSFAKTFDTDQPRDEIGRWTESGSIGEAKRESSSVSFAQRDLRKQPQVESPEFKRWFKGSKVTKTGINSRGEEVDLGAPLVVYHGAHAGFSEFDPNLSSRNPDARTSVLGMFFSDKKSTADRFAGITQGEPQVKPVYLSLQKPFEITDFKENYGYDKSGEKKRIYRTGDKTEPWEQLQEFIASHAKKPWNEVTKDDVLKFKATLEAHGHDGIIVRDTITDANGHYIGNRLMPVNTQFVAFRPTQIKSAIGNAGTFSPTDPDIRKAVSFGGSLVKNCGTGAGGFQPGNTCARGGDGGTATADRDLRVSPQTDTPEFHKWFAGSKIVDDDGKPLIVYHGTQKDFHEFRAMRTQDVYKLGGKEIVKANSWDMGEDSKGMPEGYHYGAVTDALTMGAEKALEFRTQEHERLNKMRIEDGEQPRPMSPDTQRHIDDLKRLAADKLTVSQELRPTGAGHYFTPSIGYSFIRDIGAYEGGQVMPVYLSIKNPIHLNAAEIESAGQDWRVEKYKAQGYDGAIYHNGSQNMQGGGWSGESQIVAFYPEQIKSAMGNSGAFDPNDTDVRKSVSFAGSLVKGCGANAPGGGGFQPGNTCANGDGGEVKPWEQTRDEYNKATGYPEKAFIPGHGFTSEYNAWSKANKSHEDMVLSAKLRGESIPQRVVDSLPEGTKSRLFPEAYSEAPWQISSEDFDEQYVIHGTNMKAADEITYIEPRIGDFTRTMYDDNDVSMEELGAKELAYFAKPSDVDRIEHYATGSSVFPKNDTPYILVSRRPGDAELITENMIHHGSNPYGTEPGDIVSESGAGVAYAVRLEDYKRSGASSLHEYFERTYGDKKKSIVSFAGSLTKNCGTSEPGDPGFKPGNTCAKGGGESGDRPPRNAQVDAPAFKKWFGESKVTNAAGDPLVVFHGTGADFHEFDPNKLGEFTGASSAQQAFFFSSDVDVANSYPESAGIGAAEAIEHLPLRAGLEDAQKDEYRAFESETAAEYDEDEKGWIGRVTAFDKWGEQYTYNADRNVYETKGEAIDAAEEEKQREIEKATARVKQAEEEYNTNVEKNRVPAKLMPVYLRMENPLEYDYDGGNYKDQSFTQLIEEAKKYGHDGVILRNVSDDAIVSDRVSDVYAVFDPKQIKSATGNSGKFSRRSADIRKAVSFA